MKVSHTRAATSATFDDPNLVSASGLVPILSLADKAGLHTLADQRLSVPTDKGANPIEHLLAALASCTVISYQVWAEKLGLSLDGVDVDLTGDIDLAGFFGTGEGVRPGFQGIELGVRLSGPESEADYRRLEEAVATHCPVLDNLTNGVPVRTTVEVPAA